MVYPNIITSLAPEPAPQALPDLSRLRIRDRDHDDDRRSRRRSPSRRRSRSHRRHRHDDHGYRSSRTTPMHSPRKDVRFFDESPPPRTSKSPNHGRRKSHSRDAPAATVNESAKDTSRRLYQEHRRHHDRGESSSSNSLYGSRPGSRATSRATSRANSPVASRRPEPAERPRPKRPGLSDRGYSADVLRRSDLAMTSNIATAGNTDTWSPTVADYSRPGHRRWHSKG
ncbi:hypothetical protein BST61_g4735 [Cercospora zeina]